MAKRAAKARASVKRGDFPEGEAGAKAFFAAKIRELAGGRLQKTVRAIRNVGKLGRYRPSEAQTKFAFDLLANALTDSHNRWKGAAVEVEKPIVLPSA